MQRLFHVSETPGITLFTPRPSPSFFEAIRGDVVFAIEERLLHNYLLPRDCPRVCFYAGPQSSIADVQRFLGDAPFGMVLEKDWLYRIDHTALFVYELPLAPFEVLDAGAGYQVAYTAVQPLGVREIKDARAVMAGRGVTLHLEDRLHDWADAIRQSSLQFSLIRMRNAQKAI